MVIRIPYEYKRKGIFKRNKNYLLEIRMCKLIKLRKYKLCKIKCKAQRILDNDLL